MILGPDNDMDQDESEEYEYKIDLLQSFFIKWDT